jgi:invasion protein IalB
MTSDNPLRRRLAALGVVAVLALPGVATQAQDSGTVAAWRVECAGDGKTLDCRAIQQMINREDKQLIVQLSARTAADTKAALLTLQLPLGISLTEPVQLKIDNGAVERYPVQTCTNAGCIVSIPLKDPLLAALRAGTILKISIQDTNKRTIAIDVPLLGFGLAFDKATK